MKIIEIKKIDGLNKDIYYFEQGIRVKVKTRYGTRIIIMSLTEELFDDFENDKNFQKWVKWRALDETKRAIKEKESETIQIQMADLFFPL